MLAARSCVAVRLIRQNIVSLNQGISGARGRVLARALGSSSSNGSSRGAMTSKVPDLSQIKGVLFDIDGTLTNSDPLHLLA